MPVAGLVRWGRFHLQRFGSSEFTIGLPIAILVGLAAGLGAVAFRWLITFFQSLFFDGGGTALGFMGHYYVIVLPVAGGLIVGPLVYFLAQEARGPAWRRSWLRYRSGAAVFGPGWQRSRPWPPPYVSAVEGRWAGKGLSSR